MKYNLIHSHEIWFNSLTSELSSEESKKVIISRKYFFIALLLCHDKWKHNHIAAFSKKPLKKWNHSDFEIISVSFLLKLTILNNFK